MKIKKEDIRSYALIMLFGYALCSHISITLAEVFFIASLLICGYDIAANKGGIREVFRKPAAILIGIFALWHIVCAFFGVDAANSLKDTKKLYIILMYFVSAFYISDTPARRRAAGFFALGAAFVGAYAAGTGIYHRIFLHESEFRAVSFSGNHMHAGGMLMLSCVMLSAVVFFLARDPKNNFKELMFFSAAFLLACAGLVFTFTRGSWLAALAGIFTAALLVNRKALLILVLAAAASLFVLKDTDVAKRFTSSFKPYKGTSTIERLYMWESGLKIIKDNPITGIGTANVGKVYERYRHPEAQEKDQGHLHNNLVQTGVIDGIPGALIFLSIFAALLYAFIKRFRVSEGFDRSIAASAVAVTAAFFINGMSEYNFFSSQVALIFWFIAGIGASLKSKV